jgi:uroporphyrinogen III methyltransferase/synthase
VVVTRARAQAADITSRLEELGAEVVHLPAIELRSIDFTVPERLDVYDWVIFTSTNAVDAFFRRIDDVRKMPARICAIGSATRAAVEALHVKVDLTPEDASSEGIVTAFAGERPRRVLLPRAAEARELIPESLRAAGAIVDIVDVYRNVLPDDAAHCAAEIFGAKRRPDWIAFTSGSTVRNVLNVSPAGALDGVCIASIGPATSEVIRANGLTVHAEASPSDVEGLVEAILVSVNR